MKKLIILTAVGIAALVAAAVAQSVRYGEVDVTYWDDSQVPALAIVGGATAPGLISFAGDNLLKIYGFDGTSRDEMGHFSVQLSHRYREGTAIEPHVHWCRTADPGNAAYTNVVWRLIYAFATPNGVFSQSYTNWGTNAVAAANWTHQITGLGTITNTAAKVSSILVGSITRMQSSDSDTYDGDVGLLGFDVHFQVNTPGSRTQYAK